MGREDGYLLASEEKERDDGFASALSIGWPHRNDDDGLSMLKESSS